LPYTRRTEYDEAERRHGMATLRVRYRTGASDEWTIHEKQGADELARELWLGLQSGSKLIAFIAGSEQGSDVDYGRIALRMEDVSMWHIDGLLDSDRANLVWPRE
jgi:hypothetical protein